MHGAREGSRSTCATARNKHAGGHPSKAPSKVHGQLPPPRAPAHPRERIVKRPPPPHTQQVKRERTASSPRNTASAQPQRNATGVMSPAARRQPRPAAGLGRWRAAAPGRAAAVPDRRWRIRRRRWAPLRCPWCGRGARGRCARPASGKGGWGRARLGGCIGARVQRRRRKPSLRECCKTSEPSPCRQPQPQQFPQPSQGSTLRMAKSSPAVLEGPLCEACG